MSRHSREKGRRTELAIVRLLQDRGIAAEKVSRAGYGGPDLIMPVLGQNRAAEVKCRAEGFRELYGWIADRDVLIVKADHQEPLVVIRLSFAAEVVIAAECTDDRDK
jgi:hypothetical protein